MLLLPRSDDLSHELVPTDDDSGIVVVVVVAALVDDSSELLVLFMAVYGVHMGAVVVAGVMVVVIDDVDVDVGSGVTACRLMLTFGLLAGEGGKIVSKTWTSSSSSSSSSWAVGDLRLVVSFAPATAGKQEVAASFLLLEGGVETDDDDDDDDVVVPSMARFRRRDTR